MKLKITTKSNVNWAGGLAGGEGAVGGSKGQSRLQGRSSGLLGDHEGRWGPQVGSGESVVGVSSICEGVSGVQESLAESDWLAGYMGRGLRRMGWGSLPRLLGLGAIFSPLHPPSHPTLDPFHTSFHPDLLLWFPALADADKTITGFGLWGGVFGWSGG